MACRGSVALFLVSTIIIISTKALLAPKRSWILLDRNVCVITYFSNDVLERRRASHAVCNNEDVCLWIAENKTWIQRTVHKIS